MKIYGIGENDIKAPAVGTMYNTWLNVIRRTNSKAYKDNNTTYETVTIDKTWLKLSNFKKWFDKNYKPKWHLDKDLLNVGKVVKVYGPRSCVYLPQQINKAIIPLIAPTTKGIYKAPSGRWIATVKVAGKSKHIGSYANEIEAYNAYLTEKITHLENVVKESGRDITPLAKTGINNLIKYVRGKMA